MQHHQFSERVYQSSVHIQRSVSDIKTNREWTQSREIYWKMTGRWWAITAASLLCSVCARGTQWEGFFEYNIMQLVYTLFRSQLVTLCDLGVNPVEAVEVRLRWNTSCSWGELGGEPWRSIFSPAWPALGSPVPVLLIELHWLSRKSRVPSLCSFIRRQLSRPRRRRFNRHTPGNC